MRSYDTIPMRILLLASTSDTAGMMIHDEVRAILPEDALHHIALMAIEGSLLECDPPAGYDLIVFLSKHRAQSGVNALCVHAIGNFGEARFGGRDGMLVPTHPGMLTALYRSLKAQDPITDLGAYTVSLEAVHHGPYTTTPSIFYELGSSQVQWLDRDAARIMARVLVETLSRPIAERSSFFGFGSNHYCAGFDELTDRYDFAGSCARYALSSVTEDHVAWIERRADIIVLDERSMGPEKRRIRALLEAVGAGYEKRKDL